MINTNEFIGMNVVDKTGKDIGEIKSLDFDSYNGEIKNIYIEHGMPLSKKTEMIRFSDIEIIGDNVLLNVELKMGD